MFSQNIVKRKTKLIRLLTDADLVQKEESGLVRADVLNKSQLDNILFKTISEKKKTKKIQIEFHQFLHVITEISLHIQLTAPSPSAASTNSIGSSSSIEDHSRTVVRRFVARRFVPLVAREGSRLRKFALLQAGEVAKLKQCLEEGDPDVKLNIGANKSKLQSLFHRFCSQIDETHPKEMAMSIVKDLAKQCGIVPSICNIAQLVTTIDVLARWSQLPIQKRCELLLWYDSENSDSVQSDYARHLTEPTIKFPIFSQAIFHIGIRYCGTSPSDETSTIQKMNCLWEIMNASDIKCDFILYNRSTSG